MKLHFVLIPVYGSAEAEAELNQFLAAHRILGVDRELMRAANRNANDPDNRNRNLGFRLAGALWHGRGRAADPIGAASLGGPRPPRGEHRRGPGAEVGPAERATNPRRRPDR